MASPASGGRSTGLIIAAGIFVVLLLGTGAVFAFGQGSNSPEAPSTTNLGTTTSTLSDTTTTYSQATIQTEVQSVERLLVQSNGVLTSVQSATRDAGGSCLDLSGDQQTLEQASIQRQNLASQAQNLDLRAIASGDQIKNYLVDAMNWSAQADRDYASWAADESSSNSCPNTNDTNFSVAGNDDVQASTHKKNFVRVFNPVAAGVGAQTWDFSQF